MKTNQAFTAVGSPARVRPTARAAFWTCVALLAWCAPTRAQEFKVSGFASAVAVKTSGGCQPTTLADAYQDTCTRYIVDWGHAAVATDKWALNRESRAGVQGEWKLSTEWSAVAQVTARTLEDQRVNLEWAYVT